MFFKSRRDGSFSIEYVVATSRPYGVDRWAARQLVPLIATTIAVSLIKVAAITGGILLNKWIISKFKNK